MSFFSKKTSVEDKILELIKNSNESKIDILLNLLYNSSSDLQMMIKDMFNASTAENNKTDLFIAETIDMNCDYFPCDIVIKRYDNPEIDDVMHCYMVGEDDSVSALDLRFKSIDLANSKFFVESAINPDNCGKISISSYQYRYEIVKFDTDRWHELVRALNLKVDYNELMKSIKESLEYVKEEDFYDKEKAVLSLESRLDILSTKI